MLVTLKLVANVDLMMMVTATTTMTRTLLISYVATKFQLKQLNVPRV